MPPILGFRPQYRGLAPVCNHFTCAAVTPHAHSFIEAAQQHISPAGAQVDELGMTNEKAILAYLERVATALERMAPRAAALFDFSVAEAFVWQSNPQGFLPVPHVNRQPLQLLKGIERACEQLIDNTRRFAKGLPANNALLWGARGMGKSSLVKAAHAQVRKELGLGKSRNPDLKLVEIHREDIDSLPACLSHMRGVKDRFIVFCDDLSFDKDDTSYKSLKAVLEGGIEGRPPNVVFYATSNRRHLMPRDMMENERSTAINPSEAVEEKVSLSDRFGLWLGFHNATQDEFVDMVRSYAAHHKLKIGDDKLVREALEWSITRGARSGRVAWQYIQDLAGRLGHKLDSD